MEIKQVFNSTRKEVTAKKFNIFIAISLGNKWFTKESIRKYLNLCLKFSKSKVVFLIADKIQIINYNVRNNNKKEYNIRRAQRNGGKIKKIIDSLILELPKKEQRKINVLRWEEYEEQDVFYKEYTCQIHEEFRKNSDFRREIRNIVRNSIIDKKFTEQEYLKLAEYILEEFVLTYSGIKLGKDYYGAYLYPKLFPITRFIDDLQKGKIFSELTKKLPKEKVALIIAN